MVVTAGSLQIKGVFNSKDIDRGLKRVQSGFKQVSKFGKSVTADLTRMVSAGGRLLSILTGIGTVGLAGILAFAKGAPAVAGAMADIAFSTMRLQMAVGEALAPSFDKFANAYGKFVDLAEGHPQAIRNVVTLVGALAGLAIGLKGMAMAQSFIGTIAASSVAASTLTALGYLAVIGAAGYAGYIGANFLVDKLMGSLNLGANAPIEPQITPGGLVQRITDKLRSSITDEPTPWDDPFGVGPAGDQNRQSRVDMGFQPTPGGEIHMAETDRRFVLLQWWDALWS